MDVEDAEDIYEFLLELEEIEDYIDYRISSDLIDAMVESRHANS